MAFLKSLLIGSVKEYGSKSAPDSLNKPWQTAIFKVAQTNEIYANELGFIGDEVADTKHHGGIDKAIFANSFENYGEWEKFLGFKNLPYGAMGENLTVSGLDENSVCIGDIHEIGTLVLQVTQPRKPCFKLSKRWGNKNMATEIFRTGRTGWYYKVLKNGSCKIADEIKVAQTDPVKMSIMEVNMLFYSPNKHQNSLDKFFSLTALPKSWQDDMKRRIKNSYDTEYMRSL